MMKATLYAEPTYQPVPDSDAGMTESNTATARRFIITGGPGSGKSTLIDILEQRGYRCFPEVSRELIRRESRRSDGVMPWNDLEAFARLAFTEMLIQHDHAGKSSGPSFFDRGLPDIFGYLNQRGLDIPTHYLETHAECRYEKTVFILPPWPEIYINDTERPQTPEEAEALHHAIRMVYETLGYTLIELPKLPPEARCEFVLGYL